MKVKYNIFEKDHLNRSINFFGVVLLYTLSIGIDIQIKNIFIILFFTLIFWFINSIHVVRE